MARSFSTRYRNSAPRQMPLRISTGLFNPVEATCPATDDRAIRESIAQERTVRVQVKAMDVSRKQGSEGSDQSTNCGRHCQWSRSPGREQAPAHAASDRTIRYNNKILQR